MMITNRTTYTLLASLTTLSMLIGCNSVQSNETEQPPVITENNSISPNETNTEKKENTKSENNTENEKISETDTSVNAGATATNSTEVNSEMFTDRDFRTEYSERDCISIQLNGDFATAFGAGLPLSLQRNIIASPRVTLRSIPNVPSA